jgi:hypothetical protein
MPTNLFSIHFLPLPSQGRDVAYLARACFAEGGRRAVAELPSIVGPSPSPSPTGAMRVLVGLASSHLPKRNNGIPTSQLPILIACFFRSLLPIIIPLSQVTLPQKQEFKFQTDSLLGRPPANSSLAILSTVLHLPNHLLLTRPHPNYNSYFQASH